MIFSSAISPRLPRPTLSFGSIFSPCTYAHMPMHSLTSTHAHSHVHMRTHAHTRFSAGGGKPGGRGSVPRPRSVGQLGRLGEKTEGALFDAAGGRRGREVAGRGRGGGEKQKALFTAEVWRHLKEPLKHTLVREGRGGGTERSLAEGALCGGHVFIVCLMLAFHRCCLRYLYLACFWLCCVLYLLLAFRVLNIPVPSVAAVRSPSPPRAKCSTYPCMTQDSTHPGPIVKALKFSTARRVPARRGRRWEDLVRSCPTKCRLVFQPFSLRGNRAV